MKPQSPARTAAYISSFAALIIVLGFIPPIPTGALGVPIVVQNLGVMLAPLILGTRRGTLSVALFMALACTGLPVLPGGRSGLVALVSPTAGFFIGYLFAAMCIGLLSSLKYGRSPLINFLSCVAGAILLNYLCGVIGIMVAGDVSFKAALLTLPPFLPGDIIKSLVAATTAAAVHKALPHIRPRKPKTLATLNSPNPDDSAITPSAGSSVDSPNNPSES